VKIITTSGASSVRAHRLARVIFVALIAVLADLGVSTASRADTGAPPSPSPAPSSSGGSAPQTAGGSSSASLQQEASNPIGNLTQLPFQYNMNFGVGEHHHVQDLLNFQPVVPFELTVQDHIASMLDKTQSASRSELIARVLGWDSTPRKPQA